MIKAVLARIGADVLPVIIGPRAWQSSILPDGSPCEMPAKWNPVVQPDGSQVVYNAAGVPVAVPGSALDGASDEVASSDEASSGRDTSEGW